MAADDVLTRAPGRLPAHKSTTVDVACIDKFNASCPKCNADLPVMAYVAATCKLDAYGDVEQVIELLDHDVMPRGTAVRPPYLATHTAV